ncbi:integral membrane protein [Colletotrichum graminicola]|nr:integral membrane protein [Colletotrichum graminicola]
MDYAPAPDDQTARSSMNETRGPLLIGMSAGFLAFTLVFVALRVHVRAVLMKKWGADDSFVVVAYFKVNSVADLMNTGTITGLGKHAWALSQDVNQSGIRSKLVISATLCYHLTFIVVKIAFLLQYRRAFILPTFILFCDIMVGFIGMFGIALFVSAIVVNTPKWRRETRSHASYDQGLMSTLPHVFTGDTSWDIIPALVWSEAELCCAVTCVCIPTLRPLLIINKLNRPQYSYNGQMTEPSIKACFKQKPLNRGTFGSYSQQSLSIPMFVNVESGNPEPKTPSSAAFNENRLSVMGYASSALTAGDSDDGSVEFGPVDVEVATPLSPPPQCYASPARLLSRSQPSPIME